MQFKDAATPSYDPLDRSQNSLFDQTRQPFMAARKVNSKDPFFKPARNSKLQIEGDGLSAPPSTQQNDRKEYSIDLINYESATSDFYQISLDIVSDIMLYLDYPKPFESSFYKARLASELLNVIKQEKAKDQKVRLINLVLKRKHGRRWMHEYGFDIYSESDATAQNQQVVPVQQVQPVKTDFTEALEETPVEEVDYSNDEADLSEMDCSDLLDIDPEAIDCIQEEYKTYFQGIKQGTKKVTEPAKIILETVNPLDPTNLALGPGLKGAGMALKFGTKATALVSESARAILKERKMRKTVKAMIREIDKNRNSIRSYFGKLPEKYQVHHIIPIEVLKKSEVVQAAVLDGFEFNKLANAIPLPDEVHNAYHYGYNKLILQRVEKFALDKPNFTLKEAREFIEEKVIPEWKRNWRSVL